MGRLPGAWPPPTPLSPSAPWCSPVAAPSKGSPATTRPSRSHWPPASPLSTPASWWRPGPPAPRLRLLRGRPRSERRPHRWVRRPDQRLRADLATVDAQAAEARLRYIVLTNPRNGKPGETRRRKATDLTLLGGMVAGLPNGGTQPSRGSMREPKGLYSHAEGCLRADS